MMEKVRATSDIDGVAHDCAGRLDALYRAEYSGMVRLAYTLVGNNAEAEELVQDSFVAIYRRLDEIRQPGAYLRSTVVSRCRSALRRRRVMSLLPPEPPVGLPGGAGELWDVLAKLSEDQRIAVVLRYYGRYRASEIAKIVDMPAATVRSHIRRGLATLRKELEQ
jgi:DNA-directed RNA polymerase specialized sigma24 family protein